MLENVQAEENERWAVENEEKEEKKKEGRKERVGGIEKKPNK